MARIASKIGWVWKFTTAAGLAACVSDAAHGQIHEIQFEQGFITVDQAPLAIPSVEQLQSVKIDPQVRKAVQDLDDPSFSMREQATDVLLDDSTDKLQLYAMLAGKDLTCEQRYRLLTVLQEKLVNVPRGALGVSTDLVEMHQMQRNPFGAVEGVRIAELLPGLPAERVLQVGDRITHIDGKALVQMGDLQFMVQSKRPGERVQLSVKRAKVDGQGHVLVDGDGREVMEELEIGIELGSAEALKAIGGRFGQSNTLSPVEQVRKHEANEAFKMYGPPARSIAVRGGEGALYAATMRHQKQDQFDDQTGDDFVNVDQHPAIKSLLADRIQMMRDGRVSTPRDLERWKTRLAELYEQNRELQLSVEEQEYLQRVIDRYMQLVNE